MTFSESMVAALVRRHYGMDVQVKALSGYDELNYVLQCSTGHRYILKIASEDQDLHFLEGQVKIVQFLAQSELADRFQHYILNTAGQALTTLQLAGKTYYLRLLSFLEGTFWVDAQHRTPELRHSLGHFLGKMDVVLRDFSHPALHRHYTWDIRNTLDAWNQVHCITNHEKRRIASYFLLQYEQRVAPLASTLRQVYAHNDANDYNLLVDGNHVCGLIDFGDMVYTAQINNLAVACTYAMLGEKDPLACASQVVAAYHRVNPLLEQELDLLYYLIAGRLCISVTQSAFQATQQSDNLHHFITEAPAWNLLFQLIRINPLLAQHTFRLACGNAGLIPEQPEHETLLADRATYIGRNLSLAYHHKLKIIQGAFQYLYDDRGHTYVDCVNNPSHVGHCHPVVVKRMQKQLATLNTNSRYLHDTILAYAKKLTDTLPPSLRVCYFCNSGSEANDLAIRMSRHFTRQEDVIVLDHAYHGTSTLTMDLSPYKFDGKGGTGKKPWVHKTLSPDLIRGPYKYEDRDAGLKYAAAVQRIIHDLAASNKRPAAFICETLLGVGGQWPLPEGYLGQVYRHVREAGGVCIADEVQVGFGRVGDAFWGFQLQEVVPDIVVMGKPIGNGHPLAVVVVTEEIASAFNNGMEYFNTYGGNPVSMEAGLAVLEVIHEEGMQAHAQQVGQFLLEGLRHLKQHFPIIADVRGRGLFIGVELIKDSSSLEPALAEIDWIVEYVKTKGYLLSTDGPLHNVLKIKPPMTFSQQNAEELLVSLEEALSHF